MSGDFLAQMAAGSRARVRAAQARTSTAALERRLTDVPTAPPLAPAPGSFDVIAELKLRSPAVGALQSPGEALAPRVERYARAGAAAVSVLTEPARFDGALEHLESAARTLRPLGVPAMRKDFLVDPYQVLEARVAGAGGVLLILRMLSPQQADELLECARQLSLFVLLEAFDEADIERAHALLEARAAASAPGASPVLVGIDCRDLVTLQVVPGRLEALAPRLPSRARRVAESGVGTPADAERVAAAGYDLALIGSALMRTASPGELLAQLIAAGRRARAAGPAT